MTLRLLVVASAALVVLAGVANAYSTTFTTITGGPYSTCNIDVAGTFLDPANITQITAALFKTNIEALSKTYTRTDQICLCQKRLQLAAEITLAAGNPAVLYSPFTSLANWQIDIQTFFYAIFIGLLFFSFVDLVWKGKIYSDTSRQMLTISGYEAGKIPAEIEKAEQRELHDKRYYHWMRGVFLVLYGIAMMVLVLALNPTLTSTNTWTDWMIYGLALTSIPFLMIAQGGLCWWVASDHTAKAHPEERKTIEMLFVRWTLFNWFLIGLALVFMNDTWTGIPQVWFSIGTFFILFAPWPFLVLSALAPCCRPMIPQGEQGKTPQALALQKAADSQVFSLRAFEALMVSLMLTLGSIFIVVGTSQISQGITSVACGWFLFGDYADNYVIVPMLLFCVSIASAIFVACVWAYLTCLEGRRYQAFMFQDANGQYRTTGGFMTVSQNAAPYNPHTLEISQGPGAVQASAAAAGARNNAAYF